MRNTGIRGVLIALGLLFVTGNVYAEDYYVRPDGKDSNSGLVNQANQAWRTIQHAADNIAPGDTVHIQAGIYQEVVEMSSQGTAYFPITFVGEGEVVLDGFNFRRSTSFSGIVRYYTVLDNLVFDGGFSEQERGVLLPGVAYVTIQNSIFRNFRGEWVDTNWGPRYYPRYGISYNGNGWGSNYRVEFRDSLFMNNDAGIRGLMLNYGLVEGCEFVDNTYGFEALNWGTRYTTFSGSLFSGNDYGVKLGGVYWYHLKSHHNTVYRSIFSGNGIGVLIGDEEGSAYNAASYANTVINSDFYGSLESGIKVNANFSGVNDYSGPEWFDAQGQYIINNIFLNNGGFGLDNARNQTLFPGYNLAWGNVAGAARNSVLDATNNSILADPLFVDPGAGNFALGAGSPAVDAGDPNYNDDPQVLDGIIDIGALEGSLSLADVISNLAEGTGDMPESFLKNRNNSLPLSKKLYVAVQMMMQGDEEPDPVKASNYYNSAIQKLSQDILPKTDGCASTGAPDSNDWIRDCGTQADFYQPIVTTIEALQLK